MNEDIVEQSGQEGESFLEGWDEAGEVLDDGGAEAPAEAVTGSDLSGTEVEADKAQEHPGGGAAPVAQDSGPAAADARTAQGSEDKADIVASLDSGSRLEEAPKVWTLDHDGQSVTATEPELVELARKGLDYDRVQQEYDQGKPVLDLFREFAKRAGMTVPDYVAYIRTQAKCSDGMSEADAKRAVELEDREAAVSAKEEAERGRQEAARQEAVRQQIEAVRRQADIQEFMEAFPEAAKDPQSIPEEVWEQVRAGRSLVSAYAICSAAKMREEAAAAQARAETQRRNARGAASSTGSMRSAGSGEGSKDPFLQGWDE